MSLHFSWRRKNHHGPQPIEELRPSLGEPKKGISLKGENGSTVILIHGLTGIPNEMSYLAKTLHTKGYSVMCPRLANHGEPIHILKKTTWQEAYQSVREAFQKVQNQNKGQGLIFAGGLSIGALFALLLADEFQEHLAGISCLSPILFYDGWNSTRWRYFLPLAFHTPLKKFFYFKEEPPYGIKSEAIQRRIHELYQKSSLHNIQNVEQYGYPFYPVELLYQHHLLVKHLVKRLPHIQTPLQLIQAQEDDISSIKNSQYIYDRTRSPLKEMIVLYDSYHILIADQERKKAAEHVATFFDRMSTSPTARTPL